MATPGRQRPVRPGGPEGSADQAALHAKLATMTYSFAQQMPQIPSRPSPTSHAPPARPVSDAPTTSASRTTPSDDPNFPLLTRMPRSHAPVHSRAGERPASAPPLALSASATTAWDTTAAKSAGPSSASSASRWSGSSGKVATAAEVVAFTRADQEAVEEDDSESAKHQAELALYSKLVPTTSAVPRNPGRSLGGGGLRATGSVAAQKTGRPSAAPASLHAPQPLHVSPRKGPMASRMRNLSSEVSKPQLARRVAKSNRTLSPTPCTPADESSNSLPGGDNSNGVTAVEKEGNVQTRISEWKGDSNERFLKSIESIYGSIDKEMPHQSQKSVTACGTLRRHVSDTTNGVSARPQQPIDRRLSEAFNPHGRPEPGRSPSPVPSRKSQIGALRRSSGPVPSATQTNARRISPRDGGNGSTKNGTRALSPGSSTVPPGFEGRGAGGTRPNNFGRATPDSDGILGPKGPDRDVALPQNSRAGAFREAIDTRRHSSSPKPVPSRRISETSLHIESERRLGAHANGTGHEIRAVPKLTTEVKRLSPETARVSTRPTEKHASHRNNFVKGNSSVERAMLRSEPLHRFGTVPFPTVNGIVLEQDSLPGQGLMREATSYASNSPSTGGPYANGTHRNVQVNDDYSGVQHTAPYEYMQDEEYVSTYLNEFSRLQMRAGEEHTAQSPEEQSQSEPKSTEPNKLRNHNWGSNGARNDQSSAEALVDSLIGDDESLLSPSKSAPAITGQSASTEQRGISLIDFMRRLQSNGLSSSMLASGERPEDVVLPPLPAPDEGIRFENLLRSFGWTSPDEEDSFRGDDVVQATQTGSSGRVRASVPDLGMSSGMRSGGNGRVSSPYYSHFQ